jgi:hypothetical protein
VRDELRDVGGDPLVEVGEVGVAVFLGLSHDEKLYPRPATSAPVQLAGRGTGTAVLFPNCTGLNIGWTASVPAGCAPQAEPHDATDAGTVSALGPRAPVED